MITLEDLRAGEAEIFKEQEFYRQLRSIRMSTQVASLWVKKGQKKDGTDYSFIAGNLGFVQIPPGASLVVQRNTNKTDEKHPDYYLVVDKPYEKAQKGYGNFPKAEPEEKRQSFTHDDIPF